MSSSGIDKGADSLSFPSTSRSTAVDANGHSGYRFNLPRKNFIDPLYVFNMVSYMSSHQFNFDNVFSYDQGLLYFNALIRMGGDITLPFQLYPLSCSSSSVCDLSSLQYMSLPVNFEQLVILIILVTFTAVSFWIW